MGAESQVSLVDRYLRDEGRVQVTGVQALVRALFDRVRHDRLDGRRTAGLVSGYEGSPLAGLDLELSRRTGLLDEHGLVHRPALNEELAATAVFGTQLAHRIGDVRSDGIFGVWYGKAPGLDRASDALRHANMGGTHPYGGAVAFVGDDPSAKSSSVPSASEHVLADLSIPVLYPADAQEVVDFAMHAVELSRFSGLWSALKIVTNVADSSTTATVHPTWCAPGLKGGYRHKPNGRLLGNELMALERNLHEIRLPLARDYIRASGVNTLTRTSSDRLGLVSAGKSALDVQESLRLLGIDNPKGHGIRLLKLGALYPLDQDIVREFAEGLAEIVVVEEKRGIIEPAIKEVLYGIPDAPPVLGKELFPPTGSVEPERIMAVLASRIPGALQPPASRRTRINLPLAQRTPYFCSGCPHNSSTRVPDGALVGGGIGCHTMALFQSPDQVGDVIGITQMGGEGAQWIGVAPFAGPDHWIQNMGDGTFWHSGSLAVRAAVAAGVNVTFKLLHNSAVAMTGGQVAVGSMPLPRLATLLLAEGVQRVIVTSDDPGAVRKSGLPKEIAVRSRDEIVSVQQELAKVPGVTILIHDQECAAETRRKRRRGLAPAPERRIAINELVCEGCGDCGARSNCLSVRPVETEFGRKTRIHQASCNFDESCVAGNCPSFLTVQPATTRRSSSSFEPLGAADLPTPGGTPKEASVRISGIGGTGVVTAAQILAMAAFLSGKFARTLDQTGLAQKGGAVVSDVRITEAITQSAAKIPRGVCDVYIVADALVGADHDTLRATDPDRTVAVTATAQTPTGGMVSGRERSPDPSGYHDAIAQSCRETYFLDAHALSEKYCGSDQYANAVALGAAYQLGQLPPSHSEIERAIELNGAAVARNIEAFRRGRWAVLNPNPTSTTTEAAITGAKPVEIEHLVAKRVAELSAYQSDRYAQEYSDFVNHVRSSPGGAGPVAEAVAHHLFRLMAYKDEYEVARLSLDPRLTADLERDFGPGARHRYLLKPPLLTWLGLQRKVSVGGWFRGVFRVLYLMRHLRGTAFDPFGHTRVRRIERELIANYQNMLKQALAAAPDNPIVLELAELPDLIRGYDDVKLAGVAAYEDRQKSLLRALDQTRS